MEYRNANYNIVGSIDCEINHPHYGWVPFTASPDDVELIGLEVFNQAKDVAAPYIEQPVDLLDLSAKIRSDRNQLLLASDWTQVLDAPVDQVSWAVYRQHLRDITTHANWPNLQDNDWPTKPS